MADALNGTSVIVDSATGALKYDSQFPPLGAESQEMNGNHVSELDSTGLLNNNNSVTSAAQSSGSNATKGKKKKKAPLPTKLPPRLHPTSNNNQSGAGGAHNNTQSNGFHNGGFNNNTNMSGNGFASGLMNGNSFGNGGFNNFGQDNFGNTNNTTSQLLIPAAERRYVEPDVASNSGNAVPLSLTSTAANEQRKAIQAIAVRTNVTIDFSINKDKSMSISITGKNDDVQLAKKQLQRDLMQQVNEVLHIPVQYHRFLLGAKGNKLREIENETGSRIQVPNSSANSDEVRINGSKETVAAARNALLRIFHEQVNKAQDSIDIPKEYHPLICGPYNRTIDAIRSRTLAKINIPPQSVQSNIITISGDRDGVTAAVNELRELHTHMETNCASITIEVDKAQHRYVVGVRGSGVNDILEQTGVYVEVPPADSHEKGLLLRGPTESLATAIHLVIARAKSMQQKTINVPQWLHRHLIGPKGANLKELTSGKDKTRVDFSDREDTVTVEGPQEEVEEIVNAIESKMQHLLHTMTYVDIPAQQTFHKHIIGRAGTNVDRIQKTYNVDVRVQPNLVRIEGASANVAAAKQDVEEMLAKVENEKQKDVIIAQRFHRQIIGANGRSIRDLRSEHPSVMINFPDASLQSDIVTLRGPRQDVDAVASRLMAIYKEFVNIEEVNVQIPASLHSALIGAKGHVLRNIMTECGGGVQIKFPQQSTGGGQAKAGNNNADQVLIRGPKDEVHAAKRLLLELAKEKEALSFEESISCAPDLHRFLIGKRGSNLEQIRQKTGARVVLPPPTSSVGADGITPSNGSTGDDKVIIIGSKQGVQNAKTMLLQQIDNLKNAVEKETNIDVKWHKHFVQRRFQVLNGIAAEFGGVNISFPRPVVAEDGSQETSSIIRVKGPSKFVDLAIERLQSIVEDLQSQISITVSIAQAYHRQLIGTNGSQVRDIQEKYNVNIKFPPAGGNKGNSNAQYAADGSTNFSGAVNDEDTTIATEQQSTANDDIIISGRAENCEEAKTALLSLIPTEENLDLNQEYHGLLIGQRGQGIQQLQREYDVNINLPSADKQSANYITVKGTPGKIEKFKSHLTSKLIAEWDEQRADRIARSYEEEVYIPIKFHRQIIGNRGVRITELSTKHDVSIQMPVSSNARRRNRKPQENNNDEENNNIVEETEKSESPEQQTTITDEQQADLTKTAERVIVTGYKANVEKVVALLKERVDTLEKYVTESLNLPHEIHSRVIGPRGRNLRSIIEQYGVEDINFPGNASEDRDLVSVVGLPSQVDACCDHLVTIANEFMEEYLERERMREVKQSQSSAKLFGHLTNGSSSKAHNRDNGDGFIVTGAPWEKQNASQGNNKYGRGDKKGKAVASPAVVAAPNHDDKNEFPSIGGPPGINGNN